MPDKLISPDQSLLDDEAKALGLARYMFARMNYESYVVNADSLIELIKLIIKTERERA